MTQVQTIVRIHPDDLPSFLRSLTFLDVGDRLVLEQIIRSAQFSRGVLRLTLESLP